MGLFSGIKKAFKKVFKGIKKVFKKVGEFAGKILSSDIGKALMIAAAVFTGGAAIMAGIGNAAATTGSFLTKFVAGAKGFMAGMLNPMDTWKGALGGMKDGTGLLSGAVEGAGLGETAIAQAGNAGELVESGGAGATEAIEAAPSAADAGLGADKVGTMQQTQAAAEAGKAAANVGAAANEPGLLSKGLSWAGDFAKSTGGGLILTNAIQGLAQGKALEDQLKHGDYYDRKWADPRQQLILEEASAGAQSGFLDRARRYESTRVGAVTPARPTVGYQRGERVYATGVTGG